VNYLAMPFCFTHLSLPLLLLSIALSLPRLEVSQPIHRTIFTSTAITSFYDTRAFSNSKHHCEQTVAIPRDCFYGLIGLCP
jgi:hypothetical protein